jgi:hypothetical protein
MVLRLKTWESRSPPNLVRNTNTDLSNDAAPNCLKFQPWGLYIGAGWSSPVARQAHNLKAAGSNPAPATNPINLPARIALNGFVALADVIGLVGFLPCAIRLRLVDLQLPYLSFC